MGNHSKKPEHPWVSRGAKVFGAAAVIAVLVTAVAMYIVPGFKTQEPVKATVATSTATVTKVATNTKEPPPMVPKGFKNWREVWNFLQNGDPKKVAAVLQAFKDVPNMSALDIMKLAGEEMKTGRSFAATLPAGTPSVNTGYGTGGYVTYANYTQPTDRAVLVGTDGEPKVFQSCGNPMRLRTSTKVVSRPRPSPRPRPGPTPPPPPEKKCKPVTDVGKPSNPTYVPPKEDVAPPTDGYKPGNAEDVSGDQEEDKGDTEPTEHGREGPQDGSSGDHKADPPTSDPDPPPPKTDNDGALPQID
jgi:hypothetical protein